MSHFMQDRRHGAIGLAADLLHATLTANGRLALASRLGGIKEEVYKVGLGGARDELNVRERLVELRDRSIEVGKVRRSRGDDVGNLKLIANLGPEKLRIVSPERRKHGQV